MWHTWEIKENACKVMGKEQEEKEPLEKKKV
jgi:hypothetical protein